MRWRVLEVTLKTPGPLASADYQDALVAVSGVGLS